MNRLFVVFAITLIMSLWFINYISNIDDPAFVVSGVAIGSGLLISILSFRLSLRHSQTVCIGKALLLLGLAFVFYSTAESIWFELYISDLNPYPSTADIFYIIYYSLTILFVLTIFNTFIKQKSKIAWIILISVLMFISVIYYSMSFESEYVNLGIIFVLMSTFIAASSVILAVRLHSRGMKMIWIMISITMSLNTIGDVWYYILENIENYNYHVYIDTLWFAGNLLLILTLLSFEWYEKQITRKKNIKRHQP